MCTTEPMKCTPISPKAPARRIEQHHPEALEVPGVARYHHELMHRGDRRDHGVLVEGVGLAVHQARPAAEGRAIHRQDVEALAHLIQPGFEIPGLAWILLTGQLDARLNLAEGHGRQVQMGVFDALKPGQHSAMGAWSAQL